jgi:hypothetical protein
MVFVPVASTRVDSTDMVDELNARQRQRILWSIKGRDSGVLSLLLNGPEKFLCRL